MHKAIWKFFGGTALLLAGCNVDVVAEPLQFSKQLVEAQPAPLTQIKASSALRPVKAGQHGKAVEALAEALGTASLSPFKPTSSEIYGPEFEAAVSELQAHIGIEADGVAGPLLYANLTTTAADKNAAVAQWAIRLENLAFAARLEGRTKMIVVNVPSFTLRAIDLQSGQTIVESPVIVGRPDRQTPLGRLNVIGVKYNPPWVAPPVVIKSDILPKLGKDTDWFDKHRLQAVGPDGASKPPTEVTPEDLQAGWHFFQPGDGKSALGRIKFETNSRDNIYLHDTNERGLFVLQSRARSSGCIRVQKWQELAAFILDAPADKIARKIATGETRVEKAATVPVYIEYSLVDIRANKAIAYPHIYPQASNEWTADKGPAPIPTEQKRSALLSR